MNECDWKIRFGTAGTSDSFEAKGYKSSLDIPAYTAEMGLDAFEYQCGHGVRLGVDKAGKMAADAAERGILFSVHAPYYISMSSLEEEKRLGSVRYLLQSAEVCRALGGKRIIFHSGSCGKQSREAALEKALDTMRRAVEALDEAGYGDMTLCPETMGKIGQLGTLDEVLALCGVDKRITPCIDFGHLNARTLGGIQSRADYAAILDRMDEVLGDERARRFHVHFSRIEFSAGGEKRHWTFAETHCTGLSRMARQTKVSLLTAFHGCGIATSPPNEVAASDSRFFTSCKKSSGSFFLPHTNRHICSSTCSRVSQLRCGRNSSGLKYSSTVPFLPCIKSFFIWVSSFSVGKNWICRMGTGT